MPIALRSRKYGVAELASAYVRIGRTYLRWAPSLLLLALVVFVPLGFVHALAIEAGQPNDPTFLAAGTAMLARFRDESLLLGTRP